MTRKFGILGAIAATFFTTTTLAVTLGDAPEALDATLIQMDMEDSDAAIFYVGELILSGPYTYATLPNAPVAGGFVLIENTGIEDDRLIAASSGIAGNSQLHEMALQGDIMRMRRLEGGLPIPANSVVELMPGGYHIMFMKLQQPLVEGDPIYVTLTFENAGEITIPIEVRVKHAGHSGN